LIVNRLLDRPCDHRQSCIHIDFGIPIHTGAAVSGVNGAERIRPPVVHHQLQRLRGCPALDRPRQDQQQVVSITVTQPANPFIRGPLGNWPALRLAERNGCEASATSKACGGLRPLSWGCAGHSSALTCVSPAESSALWGGAAAPETHTPSPPCGSHSGASAPPPAHGW
jgi:hypothetical protein